MATHSSILAWRIPRAEEPGALPSIGLQSVGHNWSCLACVRARVWELSYCFLWIREVPGTQSVLPVNLSLCRRGNSRLLWASRGLKQVWRVELQLLGQEPTCSAAQLHPLPPSHAVFGESIVFLSCLSIDLCLWNLFHNCFKTIKSLWSDPCQ